MDILVAQMDMRHRTAAEKTIRIVSLGRIGFRVAEILKCGGSRSADRCLNIY